MLSILFTVSCFLRIKRSLKYEFKKLFSSKQLIVISMNWLSQEKKIYRSSISIRKDNIQWLQKYYKLINCTTINKSARQLL